MFQVNRELMDLIETLQHKAEEEQNSENSSGIVKKSSEDGADDGMEEKNPSDFGIQNIEKTIDKELEKTEGIKNEDNKLESTDGDSDVNAANSETEEADFKISLEPAGGTSRKRKFTPLWPHHNMVYEEEITVEEEFKVDKTDGLEI